MNFGKNKNPLTTMVKKKKLQNLPWVRFLQNLPYQFAGLTRRSLNLAPNFINSAVQI